MNASTGRLVRHVHEEIRGYLRSGVPALTLRLAEGVAVAHDPPGGSSFGLHRCRLIAEGLLRAHERGLRSLEDRLDAVIERFREAGVDPDRPYLSPELAQDPERAETATRDLLAYIRLAGSEVSS
jgi:hypothetical protein